MNPDVMPTHDWEDVSYHGSPDYECRFCGVAQWKKPAPYCPKAGVVLKVEAEERERKERDEYFRMKAERERFEQLRKKYEE